MNDDVLLSSAKDLLMHNRRSASKSEQFTVSSSDEDMCHFTADASFIAIGLAHVSLDAAVAEMRSVFRSQWSNGFLPDRSFSVGSVNDSSSSSATDWNSVVNANAPKSLATSGIASLPVQAFGVWHIYAKLRDQNEKKAYAWLRECYPKLLHWHRYMHTARDRERSGLITAYHPLESGCDTVSEDESRKHLRSLRDCRYDDAAIAKHHSFLTKSILLSSVLYKADTHVFRMAVALGKHTGEIDEWLSRYERGLEASWNHEEDAYCDFEVATGAWLPARTIACLMPILCPAIPATRKNELLKAFFSERFCDDTSCRYSLKPLRAISASCEGVFSVPLNWLLSIGLYEQGEMQAALTMRDELIDLAGEQGFHSVYRCADAAGIRGHNASSVAALVIEMLTTRPVRLDFALNGILKAAL